MFKFLIILAVLSSPPIESPSNLNWGEKTKDAPLIKNFTRWYGNTESSIIYVSRKNIDGIEAELHLNYSNRALTSATLFLGPTGIGVGNCKKIYESVVQSINSKYGNFIYKKEIIDPIGYDLVFGSVCKKVLIGANEYISYWKHKNITIEAWLYGDDENILIAIDYIYKKEKELNLLKSIF
tara:strand:- start:23992 stop:24534 length:543 start_codon:yes stop_codon:yes gene_type:complete